MRTILAAGCIAAALLAGCSSTPAPEPRAPATTTTAATADLALCREVDKASRELNKLFDDPDSHPDASLIPAVGAIVELDDGLAKDATPAVRDEVWALADTANAWLEAYDGPRFDEAQTDLANALVAVDERCTAAGYPLQR